jgi:YHS domain-containing protein
MKQRVTMLVFIVLVGLSILTAAQTRPQRPERVRDPVCGIMVEKDPQLSAEYRGMTYYFCSKADRDQFRKDPAKYVH